MKRPKVIVVIGQTSSGKTGFSLALAREICGEIISADSRQVYRGMDIGSGKASQEEQAFVPHHMFDIADPAVQTYTVSDFVSKGRQVISEITARGNIPIVVGGTFFYVDALLGKITVPNVPPNTELRKELSIKTTDELYEELYRKDIDRARTIDKHNRVRLIRSLEIIDTLGKVPAHSSDIPYQTFTVGLSLTPDELRQRIHDRLMTRIDAGMTDEVARLHDHGVSWEQLHAFGLEYRRSAEFLQGKLSKEDFVNILERDICAFAKRQMTWLKKDKSIHWYRHDDHPRIIEDVKRWLRTEAGR